jgi:hypothetical protein
MTITKEVCSALKKRGKWTKLICQACRNRRRCKDSTEKEVSNG